MDVKSVDILITVDLYRGYKEVKAELIHCIGMIGMLLGPDAQR